MDCDLAIVGAGPAGAVAARLAAEAGLDALLIEKATLPRYKTCGGGITGRALALLGDQTLAVADHVCHAAELNFSDSLRFRTSRNRPVVVMTMRDALDDWLVNRAVRAGARLVSNTAVRGLRIHDDHVRLSTNRSDIRARYVIAADGAAGAVARAAGWPDHGRVIPAVEWEVRVRPADCDRLCNSARFDFAPVPAGYAWCFPKRAHLSLGLATLGARDHNLNHLMHRYLHHLGIDRPVSIERHGFIIPIAPRHSVLAHDRVLLTGDAAGLADPLTGEGISNAILSAKLAAQAVAAHGKPADADDVCHTYQSAVNEQIIPDLRWARRLSRLLYQMPKLRDAVFRCKGQLLAEVMTHLVSGRATYTELLSEPLNYLRLLKRGHPSFLNRDVPFFAQPK